MRTKPKGGVQICLKGTPKSPLYSLYKVFLKSFQIISKLLKLEKNDGSIGSLDKTIFASDGVLSDFLKLHLSQHVTKFVHVLPPPLDLGII